MTEQESTDLVKKLAELQLSFQKQLPEKITEINNLWHSYVDGNCDNEESALTKFHRLVHSLAGSGGTYGAVAVSSVARELERIVIKVVKDFTKKITVTDDRKLIVNELISHLGQVADSWKPSDIPFIKPFEQNAEQRKNDLENNNLIYLAEDDELLAEKLVIKINEVGYQVKHFLNLQDFEQECNKQLPKIIIMDIVFKDGYAAGTDFINKLKKIKNNFPPVIFISTRDDIEARLAASRSGAYRYFSKPLNIKKLINCLDNLTHLAGNNPYKILLVDDDQELLKYYETLLTSSGMDVRTLSNPLNCLSELSDFKPDLLVLDVYMPDCSGSELAKVIRLDDKWALMPIMYFSTESNIEQQLDALSSGGDDFLVKPIGAVNLISAVRVRARRARLTCRLNDDLKNAFRESEFYVATMNQHDIVSVADVAGNIISVNDKFCEVSEYSREELVGKNHRVLKSGMHSNEFYDELWATISNGNVWHGTICNRTKHGEEYWVESTIVPFLDFNGKPYKYVSARTDITPLRLSEERINRSQLFAKIGTWDWDIISDGLYWSDLIWELFGYKKEEIEASYGNFLTAVHPDDRQLVSEAVGNCVKKGTEYNVEHRVIWPDGTIHWLHETGDVVRSKEGTALHMLGVVQDITLRKKAELKLQETEESNRLLLESVGEGIYGLSIDGTTTFVNPVFSDILGYTAEEIIGKPLHSIIHHSHADGTPYAKEDCPIHAAITDGKKYKINDDVFWHKNGSCIHVEYTTTPVLKNGELVGVVTVFQDISRRLIAERELLIAKEDAEQANHAKSQFLSSMSHELRTPMNAIMGFGQLLTMDTEHPLGESQHENVDEIMKAANHLLRLINEVLDLAIIESGQITLSIETVMLGDVLAESLQLISPLAEKRNIDISVKIDNKKISFDKMLEEQYAVFADHVRLKQVLINILSNAVKYNSDNGNIEISCENLECTIKINIKDNGEGLTDEQKLNLFKPFERLGAEQTEIEGAGIGLVITKNILEKMDGVIGVESEPGNGCNFWIELPKDNSAGNNNTSLDEISSRESIAEKDREYTVLYIEDNPANLRLVTILLSRLPNIHLWSAHEPMLGLQLAEEHVPDVILLDINLPGIDGFEVLKRLRENAITTAIPVIAISANAMEKDIEKGLAAGFEKYITKPINVAELLESVDMTLSK